MPIDSNMLYTSLPEGVGGAVVDVDVDEDGDCCMETEFGHALEEDEDKSKPGGEEDKAEP
jgi:hypothetical protein